MKTTRKEFLRMLWSHDPYVDRMDKARIPLPVIVGHVAKDLFVKGDVTSPLAMALRHQLASQYNGGEWDFTEET